jgi:cytochrome c oxidase assembly protein Cox11
LPAAIAKSIAVNRSAGDPLAVSRSYLKAIQAQDYREAYRFISSADQTVLDRESYLQSQFALGGFAARLAKQLAADMAIRVVERDTNGGRARVTLDYKLPAGEELTALVFNWDPNKLNALTDSEQRRVIRALAKMTKSGKLIAIEGRETFNLVEEDGHWKIFLDWASGIPVSFDAVLPVNSAVEVEVLTRKLFASMDEPFQTSLKIRNRGEREVIARIEHRIEPKEYAGHIAMIACGFLSPMTLQPGEEREVSSAYLFDPGLPKNTSFGITFEFNLASASSPDSVAERTSGAGR